MKLRVMRHAPCIRFVGHTYVGTREITVDIVLLNCLIPNEGWNTMKLNDSRTEFLVGHLIDTNYK